MNPLGKEHHIEVKVVQTRWYHKLLSKLRRPIKDLIPLGSITLPLYVTYTGKFVVGNVRRTRREDNCASSELHHVH